MPKVSLNQITRQAKDDYFNLLKKTWNYTRTYDKKYSEPDVRIHFFTVFSELNLWLLIQLDSYLEILVRNTDRISRYMNLNPNSRIMFLSQYDTINRASYCTHAMFEVEYFLDLLCVNLGSNPSKSYGALVQQFLKLINMYDGEDGNNVLILKSPAHVRNSIHNNGYAGYDLELLIGNDKYHYKKGEQIYYSGWNNLYLMFDKLVDKMAEIINNPKIELIEHIPHNFMTYRD